MQEKEVREMLEKDYGDNLKIQFLTECIKVNNWKDFERITQVVDEFIDPSISKSYREALISHIEISIEGLYQ